MEVTANPAETDAEPPTKRTNPATKATSFAILTALVLTLASLLTIALGVGGEWAMSGKATLDAPTKRPAEESPAIQETPEQVLAGTVTITALRSDRKLLEDSIEATVHQAGGYLIQQSDDHRTYAAPQAMVEIIAQSDEEELPKRPDHAAYGEMLFKLKDVSGPANTSFNLRVRSTIYENPIFLDTTIVGAFGLAASIMILVVSIMAIAVIHTFNDQNKERKDEP